MYWQYVACETPKGWLIGQQAGTTSKDMPDPLSLWQCGSPHDTRKYFATSVQTRI